MPIYEYQCRSCGHDFETIQKINEDPLVDCPSCEEPELRKLISPVAFRLKGTGWYETDFKKDRKRNVVNDDTSESKPAEEGDKKASSDESTKSKSSDSKSESKNSQSESSASSVST
ncbi:MAG: zinc ribbon domain-containing protein [Gammaproteobacteria bacterium]|nr:zinc ribbon domain-containing protein [Gammaproteobacteria bacterium]